MAIEVGLGAWAEVGGWRLTYPSCLYDESPVQAPDTSSGNLLAGEHIDVSGGQCTGKERTTRRGPGSSAGRTPPDLAIGWSWFMSFRVKLSLYV